MEIYLCVILFDGFAVGTLLWVFIKAVLGDTRLARLLALIGAIGGGFAYFRWCIVLLVSEEVKEICFRLVCFAPVLFVIALCLTDHLFKKDDE